MPDPSTTLTQRFGRHAEVAGPSGTLRYRYGGIPKACVHPLTTPAGLLLTGFEFSDHVWHRGLWFTIKFVNGTNFWEEHPPYGVQVHTAEPSIKFESDGSVRIKAEIDWTSDATGVVVREKRRITRRRIADDVTAIDWSCELRAEQDLTLDRTPYTTWGGYGGLTFRSSREFHKTHLIVSTGERTTTMTGQPADWVLMNGLLDGGPDVRAAYAVVDHPANPRGPCPWYCKTGPEVNFINAAFLFHGPMTVARGQTLAFDYRVLVRDGHWTAEDFAPLAAAFRDAKPGPK